MTRTRRPFTAEDRLSLLREAEKEGFPKHAADTMYPSLSVKMAEAVLGCFSRYPY